MSISSHASDGAAARSAQNAAFLAQEIAWFRGVMERRFAAYVSDARSAAGGGIGVASAGLNVEPATALAEPPALAEHGGPYVDVLRGLGLQAPERLLLLLCFLPHVQPELLDSFLLPNSAIGRRFSEFGGAVTGPQTGFLPTGQTFLFLIAGADLGLRFHYAALLRADHPLWSRGILQPLSAVGTAPGESTPLSRPLGVTAEYVERLTTGASYQPPFSSEFPAQRISTPYEWSDLVLEGQTERELSDIVTWVRHRDLLLDGWGLRRRIKPGFRALFYGPPGTGKTLTASLLGKVTGRPVYRIDLSKVISKYIGETEKNLASLFDHAQNQDWILFFDEGDSLFGKRTESRSANDRAANQQVSYLLQRIEDFPGVAILASNMKSHLDEAFSRRFQSLIYFRMPNAEQRLRLWQESFANPQIRLADNVNLRKLAADHELSGGSIINVLRFACLRAVERTPPEVLLADLQTGIASELRKEGKFWP